MFRLTEREKKRKKEAVEEREEGMSDGGCEG